MKVISELENWDNEKAKKDFSKLFIEAENEYKKWLKEKNIKKVLTSIKQMFKCEVAIEYFNWNLFKNLSYYYDLVLREIKSNNNSNKEILFELLSDFNVDEIINKYHLELRKDMQWIWEYIVKKWVKFELQKKAIIEWKWFIDYILSIWISPQNVYNRENKKTITQSNVDLLRKYIDIDKYIDKL